ncbi:MAG: hypothetical protein WCG07_00260 [Candidatus Taylorbacteria bacterium]
MRKIIQLVTLFCFSFTYTVAPLLTVQADTGTSASSTTSTTVTAPSYALSILPTGSSTWQKSFDQIIPYDYAGSPLKQMIQTVVDRLLKDKKTNNNQESTNKASRVLPDMGDMLPKVAVYLVPVVQPFTAPVPPVNKENNLRNQIATTSDPHDVIYNNTKTYGYLVGYVDRANTDSISLGTGDRVPVMLRDYQRTNSIPAINFALVPNGQYYVRLAIGVESGAVTNMGPKVEGQKYGGSKRVEQISQKQIDQLATSTLFTVKVPSSFKLTRGSDKALTSYYKGLIPLPETGTSSPAYYWVRNFSDTVPDYVASVVIWDNIISTQSANTISVTSAPNPALLITAPFGGTTVWKQGEKHDVTWLANFKRSKENDTGLAAFDGITVVMPYGYGIKFDQGSTVDQYNTAPGKIVSTFGQIAATTIITTAIPSLSGGIVLSTFGTYATTFSIPFVGIAIGAILTILDLFGLFDDNSAPFAVGVKVEALSYSTSTNMYGTSTYMLADGGIYLETGKATVSVNNLPLGTYVLRATAWWNNWNQGPHIIATSSPVLIAPADIQNQSTNSHRDRDNGISSTTLNLIEAALTPPTLRSSRDKLSTHSTVSSSTISTTTSSSTISTTTAPVTTNTPVVTSSATTSTESTTSTTTTTTTTPAPVAPQTVSIPATISSYACPDGYVPSHNGCELSRTSSGINNSLPRKTDLVPVYTCPHTLIYNAKDHTCSKPVTYEFNADVGESLTASVANSLIGILSVFGLGW